MYEKALKDIDENYQIIKRFEGGMSNLTFLIKDKNGNKLVYRYPGLNNDIFVNYKDLKENLEKISKLNITNELVYYNDDTGIKISKYIKGNNITQEDVDFTKVANTLKVLHTSNIKFKTYNHLERLNKYENIWKNQNQQYFDLKKQWINIYETILKHNLNYPAHGDSQFFNIIKTEDDQIKILDWEFSGQNDYIYDIASFGNQNFEMAKKLLEAYESEVDLNKWQRLYGWRMFQCLQWFNVAMYKHNNGLSEQLNIDFLKVADHYLKLSLDFLNKYNVLK